MSPTHASSGTPRRAAGHPSRLSAWLFVCAALPAACGAAATVTAAAPVAGPVVAAQDNTTAAAAAPAAKAAAKPAKRRAKSQKGNDKTARTEDAPLPAPGALPPPPAAGGDMWEIAMTDRTLNAAMARWAAAAGWQLLWELPVDYAVQARTSIPGKFEDAVALVVTSMEGAEIPMKAVFYQGNKVLRIMAKGAQ